MPTPSAQMQGRIGLLAGSGEIPVYFARKAAESGLRLVSIAFSNEIDEHLKPFVEKNYCIGVWKSDKILQTLKRENIGHLLMLGKVDKRIIFKPQMPDMRAIKFLKRLATHKDKAVLDGVIREFEKEGITVLSQREYLRELFPEKGVLTRNQPSLQEMEDVEYGISIARQMADLEIGQTVVVKNKMVVAVEAAEGTDLALERGCELAGEKAVGVKVSRTDQDFRYDCPGVGRRTAEILIQKEASVLAIEAERVMVIDLPELIELADQKKLAIVAV